MARNNLPATKAAIYAAFDTLPDAVMIEVLRVGADRFSGYAQGYDQIDAGLDFIADEVRGEAVEPVRPWSSLSDYTRGVAA